MKYLYTAYVNSRHIIWIIHIEHIKGILNKHRVMCPNFGQFKVRKFTNHVKIVIWIKLNVQERTVNLPEVVKSYARSTQKNVPFSRTNLRNSSLNFLIWLQKSYHSKPKKKISKLPPPPRNNATLLFMLKCYLNIFLLMFSFLAILNKKSNCGKKIS